MRIGIDGHILGKNIGGVERYLENVVAFTPDLSPRHEFVVFITRQARARYAADTRRNVRFVSLPVSDPLIQRSVVLPWAVRKYRLDVLQVQRVAPWACGACRIMLTVHDLVPLKYPKDYTGLRNRLIRLLTPGSVHRASMIVCPTQSVCDDVARHYPRARAPLRPFYNGVDPQRFSRGNAAPDRGVLQRHGIAGTFMFSPGGVEPRKNLEIVLRAIARLEPAARPMLVLSGPIREPAYFARLQQAATDLGVSDRLRYVGFISEEDLVALYGLADLCIAASTDEGFNLLPLEAMACNTAVICSDIPVHRELYRDGARLFPPDRDDKLADEITLLLTDAAARQTLRAGAAACIARLSWQSTARRMASFFDELDVATSIR